MGDSTTPGATPSVKINVRGEAAVRASVKSAAPAPDRDSATAPAAPRSASVATSVNGAPAAPSTTLPVAGSALANMYTLLPPCAATMSEGGAPGAPLSPAAAREAGTASVGGEFTMCHVVPEALERSTKAGVSAEMSAAVAALQPPGRKSTLYSQLKLVAAPPAEIWGSVAGPALVALLHSNEPVLYSSIHIPVGKIIAVVS